MLDGYSGDSGLNVLQEMLNPCRLCPRMCMVNRLEEQKGLCGIGSQAVVSSAGAHFGEESVLVGSGGSGTIFFAGCNLDCIFCQNYDISHERRGREVDAAELAELMLGLQRVGCININLVTPTHVIAQIVDALELAKKRGLTFPVVYNSGGYDSTETLKELEGIVDIYMPDMKYADPAISEKLSEAGDYPEVNRAAVREMHRQVGNLQIQKGIARRGLLVRHLVLPENQAGTKDIVDFLALEISSNTAINIMDQYRPCYRARLNPLIHRRCTDKELKTALAWAQERGLQLIS